MSSGRARNVTIPRMRSALLRAAAITLAVLVYMALSGLLAGCASQPGSKEEAGTAIGSISGMLVGAAVSNDTDRIRGVVLGGLLGGFIGNRIGASLDERDRLALLQSTESALNSADVNQTVGWQSDHTDANASIEILSEESRLTTLDLEPQEAARYRFTASAITLHSGPSDAYSVTASLRRGALVQVLGDGRRGWYRVAIDGDERGYGDGRYLISSAEHQARLGSSPAGASGLSYGKEELTVVLSCRDAQVSVEHRGHREVSNLQACRGPDGRWYQ